MSSYEEEPQSRKKQKLNTITETLNKFNAAIQANPAKKTMAPSGTSLHRCKFGQECVRENRYHFSDFHHPIDELYLSGLNERIVTYKPYVDALLEVAFKHKSDRALDDNIQEIIDWFIMTNGSNPAGKGATNSVILNKSKRTVRYFPEDTVYFYLLAILHKYFDSYAAYSINALMIFLMRIEEAAVTGIYKMTPREYTLLFGITNADTSKGIDIADNFILLGNTTLYFAFQKSRPKRPMTGTATGGRRTYGRKVGRRRKTVKRKKGKKRD